MGRKATSAELRAWKPDAPANGGHIRSTNCEVSGWRSTGQSRAGSLAEAITNVVAGFFVSLVAQQAILPLFSIHLPMDAHIGLATIFTLLSLMRSYALRRLFDHLDHIRRRDETARQERLRQAFCRGRM